MNKLNPTIKINRRNAVAQKLTSKNIEDSNKKVSVETKKDQVSLSQTSKIKASIQGNSNIVSDVRHDLINKYSEKLDSGAYVVKAEELADKIVQKIRENKNRIVM